MYAIGQGHRLRHNDTYKRMLEAAIISPLPPVSETYIDPFHTMKIGYDASFIPLENLTDASKEHLPLRKIWVSDDAFSKKRIGLEALI